MRRFLCAALVCGLLLSLASCGGADAQQEVSALRETPAEREVFAMDTVMMMTAYGETGEETLEAAEAELYRLEHLLDRTENTSAVSQLNDAQGREVSVGREVCGLLRAAEQYALDTDGAFDMTIAPVSSAWGFTEKEHRVPTQAELDQLLEYVGTGHITLTEETATLTPGTKIDLGGIAKGYASDRVRALFQKGGITRGKVALGGNVLVMGTKPNGEAWRVGVQDPRNPEGYAGIVELTDAFAVTSGGYQRFFEENGQIYHHVIDPKTGYPADSGLTSVTVIADSGDGHGTMCDALSTALFVMGEEKAVEFWRTSKYAFELILVTEDGRVVVTQGLADRFTVSQESGYAYETVS